MLLVSYMYSPQAQRTPEGEDYFLSVFFVKTAGVTSILELPRYFYIIQRSTYIRPTVRFASVWFHRMYTLNILIFTPRCTHRNRAI